MSRDEYANFVEDTIHLVIQQFGTVFKVYDDQDSGNICFGTEKDEKKLM